MSFNVLDPIHAFGTMTAARKKRVFREEDVKRSMRPGEQGQFASKTSAFGVGGKLADWVKPGAWTVVQDDDGRLRPGMVTEVGGDEGFGPSVTVDLGNGELVSFTAEESYSAPAGPFTSQAEATSWSRSPGNKEHAAFQPPDEGELEVEPTEEDFERGITRGLAEKAGLEAAGLPEGASDAQRNWYEGYVAQKEKEGLTDVRPVLTPDGNILTVATYDSEGELLEYGYVQRDGMQSSVQPAVPGDPRTKPTVTEVPTPTDLEEPAPEAPDPTKRREGEAPEEFKRRRKKERAQARREKARAKVDEIDSEIAEIDVEAEIETPVEAKPGDKTRDVYQMLFENFAMSTGDVAEELGISKDSARKLLTRMSARGLISSEDVNLESQGRGRRGAFKDVVWQTNLSPDDTDLDTALAEAGFDSPALQPTPADLEEPGPVSLASTTMDDLTRMMSARQERSIRQAATEEVMLRLGIGEGDYVSGQSSQFGEVTGNVERIGAGELQVVVDAGPNRGTRVILDPATVRKPGFSLPDVAQVPTPSRRLDEERDYLNNERLYGTPYTIDDLVLSRREQAMEGLAEGRERVTVKVPGGSEISLSPELSRDILGLPHPPTRRAQSMGQFGPVEVIPSMAEKGHVVQVKDVDSAGPMNQEGIVTRRTRASVDVYIPAKDQTWRFPNTSTEWTVAVAKVVPNRERPGATLQPSPREAPGQRGRPGLNLPRDPEGTFLKEPTVLDVTELHVGQAIEAPDGTVVRRPGRKQYVVEVGGREIGVVSTPRRAMQLVNATRRLKPGGRFR